MILLQTIQEGGCIHHLFGC